MMSRVNLVAVLLTLGCVARALESSRSAQEERQAKEGHRGYLIGKKVLKEAHNRIVPSDATLVRVGHGDKGKVGKLHTAKNGLTLSKNDIEEREHPRRRKRKMDRAMLALLMAYKMKFIALVPTLVGGLILLKATALLAGFFFALFAAVLGLKAH